MFKRYSKEVIEPFALKTIASSFDKKYELYHAPKDTDNFDYVSPKNDGVLEVTTAIPENVMNAYIYENERAKGKDSLKTKHIKKAKVSDDGDLLLYYGGTMHEIIDIIKARLDEKQEKALKRLGNNPDIKIDLCICMADGALFNLQSFELAFTDLNKYIFNRVFFITPTRFIYYSKGDGFKEQAMIFGE